MRAIEEPQLHPVAYKKLVLAGMTMALTMRVQQIIEDDLSYVPAKRNFQHVAGHFSQSVWKTFFEGFFEECDEEYDEEYASDFRP